MTLIVQKFGGTSMGSIERIGKVAQKIIETKKKGHDIVVVVSAMAGETDRLIQLAKSIQEIPDPRAYAVLLATGEQVAIALLAMTLLKYNYPSRTYTGGQAGILTDSIYQKARIQAIKTDAIYQALQQGNIPIIAGFQGINNQHEITILGRGGSDTTAVAIAASLNASECQIYTDVEGVFTADPRIVPEARRLDKITFEEMLELASLGAKVLQMRAVEFAGKYKVPLRVLSSFQDGQGTLITFEDNPMESMESPLVSGITYNQNEAKLTIIGIPDIPGVVHRILEPISEAKIDIDMIIQNGINNGKADLTFTVARDDYQRTLELLDKIVVELGAEQVIGDKKIAKLSIVGFGMRSHSGVANVLFKTLAREGINIKYIATSEIKVSVIIDEKYLELGLRALHTAFNLDRAN